VIKLARILKDYQDTGAFHALINIACAIHNYTFLTKSGDLVTFVKLHGIDAECIEPQEVDQVVRRFGSAVRIFTESYRIYQYLIKRDFGPIPRGTYRDRAAQEAVESRAAYLDAKRLYRLEIYMAVVLERRQRSLAFGARLAAIAQNPGAILRPALSARESSAAFDEGLERSRQELAAKVGSFAAQLRDFLKIEILEKQQAFSFLRGLVNYAQHKVNDVRLGFDPFVDFQMTGSSLECHRDHLRLDDYYAQVLTLKDPPAKTWAHVLQSFQDISAQFVMVTEWKRLDNAAVRRLVQSKRRHFYNSKASLLNYLNTSGTGPKDVLIDDSAAALVNDLGLCLEEMELQDLSFGEFSLSILLYDEDRERLRRSISECWKAFSAIDAQPVEERYNLLNAFLAVLPGNDAFNLRKMLVSSANYADLSFLFTPALRRLARMIQ
jgi:type IV secretory pathway VirB4 component